MSEKKSATTRAGEVIAPLAADPVPVTAGVRELRDHLSQYLDVVKAGNTVTVTEHGAVIATIVPLRVSARTMELYRHGKVGLPRRPKQDYRGRPRIHLEGGLSDLIDEGRDDLSSRY